MPPERLPVDIAHEITNERESTFDNSVNRLFSLLDQEHASYFKAEWDEEYPQELSRITTMETAFTGARKQENKGRFSLVQAKIVEASDTGESNSRFIWLDTGLQYPGTPITIDYKKLASEHGYHAVTPDTIVQTLVTRAETIGDYKTLVQALKGRDIKDGTELAKGLNALFYKLVFERSIAQANDLTPGFNAIDSDQQLFELLQSLNGLGLEFAMNMQGHLLSRLLRGISLQSTHLKEHQVASVQDRAAALLEAALESGVLFSADVFVERICGYRTIYQYPFATNFLHEHLPDNSRLRNIYGTERRAFVRNYITSVLAGRMKGQDEDTEVVRQTRHLLGALDGASGRLQDLVSFEPLFEVAVSLDILKRLPESDRVTPDAHLQYVPPVFYKLLAKLRSSNPQLRKEQKELDSKSREIVETLLRPITVRRLGKRTIQAASD